MLGRPTMRGPIQRNVELNKMAEKHCYEIIKWPAYFSDIQVMNMLRRVTDPNIIYFIAAMRGITPIVTIGGYKSFIADLSPEKKRKRSLPKRDNMDALRREQEAQLKKLRK